MIQKRLDCVAHVERGTGGGFRVLFIEDDTGDDIACHYCADAQDVRHVIDDDWPVEADPDADCVRAGLQPAVVRTLEIALAALADLDCALDNTGRRFASVETLKERCVELESLRRVLLGGEAPDAD